MSATTIKFKGAGFNISVTCEQGATCNDAIDVFERTTSKVLKGMDFYANGQKITDLGAEAPEEIVAIKSKHESA